MMPFDPNASDTAPDLTLISVPHSVGLNIYSLQYHLLLQSVTSVLSKQVVNGWVS